MDATVDTDLDETIWLAFGRLVQAHREMRDMSRKDLAAKLGLSRQTLYHIESGHRGVSLAKVYDFARLFGVKASDLLPAIGPQNEEDEIALLAKLMARKRVAPQRDTVGKVSI